MDTYRNKSQTKTQNLTPIVIALVEKNFTFEEIIKGLGISDYKLKKIIKENNLTVKRAKKGFVKRNQEILELLKNDNTYISIARKYNISKQRVTQIANDYGYDRMASNKEKIFELIEKIKIDISDGLKYDEIKKKHSLNDSLRNKISYHGLPLFSQLNNRRKNSIVDEYKQKTARKVLESNNQNLHNPFELKNINNVYSISSQMGYKRYPKIGNRNKGGVQENIGILEIIKHKREKENLSFSEIATHLNESGYLTISDKEFKEANTRFKYLYYTGKLEPLNQQKNKSKKRTPNIPVDKPIDVPANKKIVIRLR
jgi:hypothetical protein